MRMDGGEFTMTRIGKFMTLTNSGSLRFYATVLLTASGHDGDHVATPGCPLRFFAGYLAEFVL